MASLPGAEGKPSWCVPHACVYASVCVCVCLYMHVNDKALFLAVHVSLCSHKGRTLVSRANTHMQPACYTPGGHQSR